MDEEISLKIEGYYALLSLHKALLEARFHPNPMNNIAGSPFTAQIHCDVIDQLTRHDVRWEEWRKLQNRLYYRQLALDLIAQNKYLRSRWEGLSSEEKAKITFDYLSPFRYTEEERHDFIADVTSLFAQKMMQK